MVGAQCAGSHYLVAASGLNSIDKLWVINTDQMAWTGHTADIGHSYFDESQTRMCVGPQGGNSTSVYTIAFPAVGYPFNTDASLYLHRTTIESTANTVWQSAGVAYAGGTTYFTGAAVTDGDLNYVSLAPANTGNTPSSSTTWWQPQVNPGISTVLQGSLTPTQIDASLAGNTFALASLIYDPLDGNLILSTNGWVVKINPNTMTIVWKAHFSWTPTFDGVIGGGTLCFMGGATVYTINTQTGAVSTYNPPGVTQDATGLGGGDYNLYNSTTGMLVCALDYSSGAAGAPLPTAGTPLSFNQKPAQFTIGSFMKGYLGPSFTRVTVPAVVGFTYTSSGQLLTPISQPDTGAQLGPGFAKLRRHHQYGALLQSTQGISFGTSIGRLPEEFGTLRSAKLGPLGSTTAQSLNALFSGTFWETIQGDYTLDDSLCWQVTRPYPVSIAGIGGFLQTQDR